MTKKLYCIAKMVKYRSVADIGCDHGFLPVYLCKIGKIDKAVASDKNSGPLSKAKSLVTEYGLERLIDVRLGSGLSPLGENECETCVISGMGGMTIIEILESHKQIAKNFKQLIFSPERNIETLRRFLHVNGYSINNEAMVLEKGVFYNIIDAKYGLDEEYNTLEYLFGKILIEKKDKLLKKYIAAEMSRIEKIISSLENDGKSPPEKLRAFYNACKKTLEGL